MGRDGDEYGAFSSLIFSFMMSIFHVFGKRRAYACVCVLLQSSSEAVQRGVLSIVMRHRFQDKMIGGNLLHELSMSYIILFTLVSHLE